MGQSTQVAIILALLWSAMIAWLVIIAWLFVGHEEYVRRREYARRADYIAAQVARRQAHYSAPRVPPAPRPTPFWPRHWWPQPPPDAPDTAVTMPMSVVR